MEGTNPRGSPPPQWGGIPPNSAAAAAPNQSTSNVNTRSKSYNQPPVQLGDAQQQLRAHSDPSSYGGVVVPLNSAAAANPSVTNVNTRSTSYNQPPVQSKGGSEQQLRAQYDQSVCGQQQQQQQQQHHQQQHPQHPQQQQQHHPQQHPQQQQQQQQQQHQQRHPQQPRTSPRPKSIIKPSTATYPGAPSPIQPRPPPSTATSSSSIVDNILHNAPVVKSMKNLMPVQPRAGLSIRMPDEEVEDGRVGNKEAVKKIQDDWFCKQIWARAQEFTKYSQARIFLGTWNVNAKGKDEDLSSWLCHDWGGPTNPTSPDIVAVGLQEMVDLNAVNVALDNKASQRSQHWIERIRHTLNSRFQNDAYGEDNAYNLHATKYMVGLLLCVFVKNKHKHRVKHVHVDSVCAGVMGMMGNKGGVSVRLQFYDSTICIVNSHLAAHRENVAGRNADFGNLYSKSVFRIGNDAVNELVLNGALKQWTEGGGHIGIPDHDMSFWIGDLNYRVDESISTDDVLELSKAGDLDLLRNKDQLNLERQAGRCFQGFREGKLNFRPTYKYQPGTGIYDERPDKKIRAPAWCDRVLWRAQVSSHVQQVNYLCSELNVSDHKPVMSTFVITVKDVIESEREKVLRDVNKILDQFDNKNLPMVGLDKTSLDFGYVRYGQTITLPIKVTNTGKVVAQFRVIPKLEESRLCQPWMKISPAFGMLIPGETEQTIKFTITVDNAMANALNTGREVLEDIIILRLENGRDYYITITGQYARSCFGMAVDDLVMYTDPIREVPLDPIKRIEKYGNNQKAEFCIPKELFRLIDAIFQKGLDTADLFSIAGQADEMDLIRECLDTGAPFDGDYRIHSYADVLVTFLSNLSHSIVPPKLFPGLEIDEQNLQFYARKFLDELPPIHYNVFIYVTSFFRECRLRQQEEDLMPAKLARICCNCLVEGSAGVNDEGTKSAQRRRGMEDIMIHFLETNTI